MYQTFKLNHMRSTTEIYELAAKYRGNVLNEMSYLEKLIEVYIADYFTNGNLNKSNDMHLLILGDNRISYESKRQIFNEIAVKNNYEWYISYTGIKNHPKPTKSKPSIGMNKDLIHVIEQRNLLAHCIVDTSDKARNENNKISFLRFKNDIQSFDFDNNSYSELMFIIKDLTKHLYKLIG